MSGDRSPVAWPAMRSSAVNSAGQLDRATAAILSRLAGSAAPEHVAIVQTEHGQRVVQVRDLPFVPRSVLGQRPSAVASGLHRACPRVPRQAYGRHGGFSAKGER
jgi:hypothetical protein